MDQRYLAEPYEFVKPYRSTIWSRLVYPFYGYLMNRLHLVSKFDVRGHEHITQSVNDRHGQLLGANHCRYSDPFVFGALTKKTGAYMYFCASWHLFKVSWTQTWLIRRMGAMSIYREGGDRDCIRECQRILESGERPLVLFPEGTFYRQNDQLGPLQDGVSFIARIAQKSNKRPIDLFPVAIKYWFLEDPRDAIERRLCSLEQRCHMHPKRGKDYVERLKWIGHAFLTIKELELLGSTEPAPLDERQARLADQICRSFEENGGAKARSRETMERIRQVRNSIVKKFIESPHESPEWYEYLYQIEDLAFAQQLFSHRWNYIDEWQSLERVSETLMRLEEDLYDVETPMAKMGVVIQVGKPIAVADYMDRKSRDGDPLTLELQTRIQGMLDQLVAEGPPSDWGAVTGPKPTTPAVHVSTDPLLQSSAAS